jgi:uncharacterized protein (TIGR02217 family)
MEFVDLEFPERIAFGARSEPGWQTEIGITQGGVEATNQTWTNNRHYYDVSLAIRTASLYALVREHFNVMQGRTKYFPFKDFLDFSVTSAQGFVLDPDDLSAITANGSYQLFKVYGLSAGAHAYYRRITRPRAVIAVWRNRGGVITNITGAGAAVTYTTGAVVISGHVAGDTYSWSGEFRVPCRYDVDRLPAAAVNKQGKRSSDAELFVTCEQIPVIEVRDGVTS